MEKYKNLSKGKIFHYGKIFCQYGKYEYGYEFSLRENIFFWVRAKIVHEHALLD
jgi:hypothetical protein